MTEPVIIGNATLYHGDARDVLPELSADAVVTDPPYGIEYSSGTTNRKRAKAIYAGAFVDSREYVASVCIPIVKAALYLCKGRGAVTPGVPCLWLYPEPSVLGGLYQPSAVGLNRWGFANFNPVLFYGKDPRAGKHLSHTVLKVTERPSCTQHPCAKPQVVMDWLVKKVSLAGEKIIDPFMGSGTTGVSCALMNRQFIGIELERKYFDIACERIENAQRQVRMFV